MVPGLSLPLHRLTPRFFPFLVCPFSLSSLAWVVFLVFCCLVLCGFCVWFGCFVFDFLLVFGFFWFCLVSLCSFARLSSFTDWCTAHRQQFREQKNPFSLSSPSSSNFTWTERAMCILLEVYYHSTPLDCSNYVHLRHYEDNAFITLT